MPISYFCLILFLIPFANLINCKNEKENGHDSQAIFKLQARARLATCHHGVGVYYILEWGKYQLQLLFQKMIIYKNVQGLKFSIIQDHGWASRPQKQKMLDFEPYRALLI
uniref:Uncharacterized protein n=1 Tax=Meloidogyne enterolobii TaxID=390850 RepID=A0A6V7TRX0_MELEN|nr:unnamed protein product [Meloidogyne enterolobii]